MLLRAVENRLHQWLFLPTRQVARYILHLDRRVIDENAHREREPAQRHRVDGLLRGVEADDRKENREWNRDGDDHGVSPSAEKQQDHQRGERRRDQCLADHAIERSTNIHALVEARLEVEGRRDAGLDTRQGGAHALDDVKR